MKKNSRKKIWKRSICMLVAMYALFQCCFLPQDAEAFDIDTVADGDVELWTWDRMDTIKDFSKANRSKYKRVLLMSVTKDGTYVCGLDSNLYWQTYGKTYSYKSTMGEIYQLDRHGLLDSHYAQTYHNSLDRSTFKGNALTQIPIAEAQKIDPNIENGSEHFVTASDISQLEVSILGGTAGAQVKFRMYQKSEDASTEEKREIVVNQYNEKGYLYEHFGNDGKWPDNEPLYWTVNFGLTWNGTEWTYDTDKCSNIALDYNSAKYYYKSVSSPANTGYICSYADNFYDDWTWLYDAAAYWLDCDGSIVFPEQYRNDHMYLYSPIAGYNNGTNTHSVCNCPIYKTPFYVYFGYAGGANVYKNRTVYAGQVLTVNPCDLGSYVTGTMTIEPGGVLVVEGLLVNSGRINNYGTIIIKKGGIISTALFTSKASAGQLYCYGSTQYYDNSVTKTKGKGDGGLIIKEGGRLALNTPLMLYAANLTVDGELSLGEGIRCMDSKSTLYWRSSGFIWMGYKYKTVSTDPISKQIQAIQGMAKHIVATITDYGISSRFFRLKYYTDDALQNTCGYYERLEWQKDYAMPDALTVRYEEDFAAYKSCKNLMPQNNASAEKYGTVTNLVYYEGAPHYTEFYRYYRMFDGAAAKNEYSYSRNTDTYTYKNEKSNNVYHCGWLPWKMSQRIKVTMR